MVRAHIQVVCLGLEFVVSLYKSTLRTFSNMGTSARLAHEDVPIGPGTAGTDGVISVVQSVPTVRSKYIRKTGRAGTTATEPNPSTSPQRDTTSIRVFDGGKCVRVLYPKRRGTSRPLGPQHRTGEPARGSTRRGGRRKLRCSPRGSQGPPNSADATGNTFGAEDGPLRVALTNDPFCAGEDKGRPRMLGLRSAEQTGE